MAYSAKLRRVGSAGFLIIAGILVACIAVELLLRLIYPPSADLVTLIDPTTGLSYYTPESTFAEITPCIDSTVVINRMGFHGPDVSASVSTSTFRIVVVGSSFVEAAQVPIGDMFTTLLEDKLNANPKRMYTYQVVPIGFSSNGTYLDVLYFVRWGAPLKPDLVIDLTTDYEISKDAGAANKPQFDTAGNLILEPQKVTASPAVIQLKKLLRSSRLVMSLYSRYVVLSANESAFFANPALFGGSTNAATSTIDIAAVWPIEHKLLDAFAQQAKQNGAKFVLASWMTPQASASTATYLQEEFMSAAASDGFSYADLAPSIASSSATTGESPVWSCDDHWSAAGHAFAADALYQFLMAHPALLQR